jgi:hypothetical protein
VSARREPRLCAVCGKRVYAEPRAIAGREQLLRWAREREIKLALPLSEDLHLGCAGVLRRELAERLLPA